MGKIGNRLPEIARSLGEATEQQNSLQESRPFHRRRF